MKQSVLEKYLGDHVSVNDNESVLTTIKKRAAIVNSAIYEIRNVVDDKKTESLVGLSIAFLMWEMEIIPMLL